MQICSDRGYNDIGVVIATKWRHYQFYLQQFFSALKLTFQQNLFTSAKASYCFDWSIQNQKLYFYT